MSRRNQQNKLKFIVKFIPSVAAVIFWVGLQMSGIAIHWLGYSFMVFAGLLLLIPYWSHITRIFRTLSQTEHKWVTVSRYIILPLIIVIAVLAFLNIGFSQLYNIRHEPTLSFNALTETSVINDDASSVARGYLKFHVGNVGNSAAYQIQNRICSAPSNQPSNILSQDDLYNSSPVQPEDFYYFTFYINMPYTLTENGRSVPVHIYDIYYRIGYSNASKGGKWQYDEYWYTFDFGTKTLGFLTEQPKLDFQKFVKAYYAIKDNP